LKLSGLPAVVPRQLPQHPAVSRRAEDLEQGLDPMVAREGLGEAQVVILAADGEEAQARLLADQPEADPGIGPAVADRLRDAAVVRCQVPGVPPPAEQLVEALPRPGPGLAADPAQLRAHGPPHGREAG